MSSENEIETPNSFYQWLRGLDASALDLWHEAMAQLRQLHGDVWNGVRFFVTVNGIIVAAIFAIFRLDWTLRTGVAIVILAGIGLFLTLIATSILEKHRNYYLEMLLRKTLLEEELGFYESHLQGIDLSFPWKADVKDINEIVADPDKWKAKQRWHHGTISRLLRMTYWLFIVLYVIALIGVVVGICN